VWQEKSLELRGNPIRVWVQLQPCPRGRPAPLRRAGLAREWCATAARRCERGIDPPGSGCDSALQPIRPPPPHASPTPCRDRPLRSRGCAARSSADGGSKPGTSWPAQARIADQRFWIARVVHCSIRRPPDDEARGPLCCRRGGRAASPVQHINLRRTIWCSPQIPPWGSCVDVEARGQSRSVASPQTLARAPSRLF